MQSFNNEELIMSLNKIKSYIDNNAIQLKVELPYIYYKLVADYEWQILLDLDSLYVNEESVAQQKQIEIVTFADNFSWKYSDENESLARPVAYFEDLKGPAGIFKIDEVYDELNTEEKNVLGAINEINNKLPKAGTTEERPVDAYIGFMYLDTTLGKPVWFNGVDWIDAIGTIV